MLECLALPAAFDPPFHLHSYGLRQSLDFGSSPTIGLQLEHYDAHDYSIV